MSVVIRSEARAEKYKRNIIPRIISGMIIGRVAIYSTVLLVRSLTFVMPTAARVPITPADRLLSEASMMLLMRASSIDLSLNRSAYHLNEKPSHTELILLSLKE